VKIKMVNGIQKEDEKNNWRAVHIQAGYYQISIGSTYDNDNLDDIIKKADKELSKIKKEIPIDKVPSNNEVI